MTFSLSGVVLDSPGPRESAEFYRRLLGWEIGTADEGWATVVAPGGGTKVSFQLEPLYRKPTWPSDTEHQQMQLHLDIQVDDLAAACEHATSLGARLADWQPQDHVRVFFDPDGHVFCLFVD
jgi:catechol 2,3-dioxygenase-like lactoylglutathione lyase family enzyme